MSLLVITNLIVFAAIIFALFRLRRPGVTLSRQILAGLVAGVVYDAEDEARERERRRRARRARRARRERRRGEPGELPDLELAAGRILDCFATRPHVFNLGHGIGQYTPIEHVERMLAAVRGWRPA